MYVHRRALLLDALKVFDIVLLLAAFLAAAFVTSSGGSLRSFGAILGMRLSLLNAAAMAAVALVWHLLLSAVHLYDSHRLTRTREELAAVFRGASFCTGALALLAVVRRPSLVNLAFVNVFWLAALVLMGLSRVAFLQFLRLLRLRGRNLRRVLVAGSDPGAVARARELERAPALGYVVEGFVAEQEGAGPAAAGAAPVVCTTESLGAYLNTHVVDEILVCLPMRTHYAEIARILETCENHGTMVRVLSDAFDLRIARARVESLNGRPVLTFATGGMNRRMVLVKEVFDFCAALGLIALTSPVMLAAAVAIKLTSRGPVLFAQERLGINKRRFRVYKFRTMVDGAEARIDELRHLSDRDGPVFKMNGDPRVTPVGRVLRRLSIDELPQLFNVLKGDMSLVGPRPLPVRDYNGFSSDWHRRRFSVKPGITCIWQVSGRNSVSFEDWMRMDMEYIDNWSLGLDLRILLKTVPAVLSGSGAS